MNNLVITIKGLNNLSPLICVDGNQIKFKKNEFHTLEAQYSTNNSEVDLTISKFLEINAKNWLFMYLLFFFISIFGIFDAKYDSNCIVIDCHYKLKLNGNNHANIIIDMQQSDEDVIKIEYDDHFDVINYNYYFDANAKSRLKKMKLIKLGIWALAVCIILLIILL